MADESREIRKNRALRRLRGVILVATLLAVAAVVALFLAGRDDRPSPPEEDLEAVSMEPTGELVTVGEGFERTFSEGDRPVFVVRGARYAVDREGIVFLEEVQVAIHREAGAPYEISAEQARLDMETQEGWLAGGVRIAAPGELELTMPRLQVTHRGRQARSDAAVRFRLGDAYEGQAEGLRAWLVPRRFLLEGYVKVESLPGAEEPLHLQASGLILDRSRNLVRSRKWAVLRRRGERVSALGMEIFFAEDETTPRFVRAEGNVEGFLRTGPGGALEISTLEAAPEGEEPPELEPEPEVRRVSFHCDALALLLGEDGRDPERLELEGGARGRAVLRALGPPGGPHYRLGAPSIVTAFEGGEPATTEASGRVVLVMNEPEAEPREPGDEEGVAPPGGATRRATAGRALARFEAGELRTVTLEQDVVLTDGVMEATGETAVVQVGDETGEIAGRPAVATSERGRMEAPRILYTDETGLLHGTGGVRALLEQAESSALVGSPLARGEGPIRVEAADGFLRDEPRAFLFTGDVRAWRGEDLLVSQELRGDEPEGLLTASGGVRTLWTPEEEERGETPPRTPLEVEARELVYRSSERVLVYTGDVVAEEGGRTLACSELVVELAEEGGMDLLVCTGEVRIEDPEQGRTLRGHRAVYQPGERTVDVLAAEGGKVTMRDREGNVIEGPRMIYDIDEDRVRVVGRDAVEPAREPPAAPAAPSEPVSGAP